MKVSELITHLKKFPQDKEIELGFSPYLMGVFSVVETYKHVIIDAEGSLVDEFNENIKNLEEAKKKLRKINDVMRDIL